MLTLSPWWLIVALPQKRMSATPASTHATTEDLLAEFQGETRPGAFDRPRPNPWPTLHRQDARKGAAPPRAVLLPRFGVEALTALVAEAVDHRGSLLTAGRPVAQTCAPYWINTQVNRPGMSGDSDVPRVMRSRFA